MQWKKICDFYLYFTIFATNSEKRKSIDCISIPTTYLTYLRLLYIHVIYKQISYLTMVFFQWSCMDVRVGLWRKLSAEELMLLNSSVGEDSWESLGLQGDPTSPFYQSRFNSEHRMLGAGALGWPRGMVWGKRWEGASGWGTRVQPWQIHVDVWQKQYNIVK